MDPETRPVDNPKTAAPASTGHPSFREAFLFWVKLGFISFGGPTGQIAIMQTELVERKKWISQSRFLHALNYCMLLPGPEATQLAIYVGWLLHKTRGGIAAGALFVIPSMCLLWTLSYVYAAYGGVHWVAAIFYGLKPAVMAIVASAVIRIGKKALKNRVMWGVALLAFAGIFVFKIPFPAIIVGAGLTGLVGGKYWREYFLVINGSAQGDQPSVLDDHDESPEHTKPSVFRAMRVCVTCVTLWWTPTILVGLWRGWDHTICKEGLFFAKAALVTFGGAYAVLPYVGQQAVDHFGWLHASQMMDGLGLAETTPGPLIMVTQFIGFMGGWNKPGGLAPLAAASLGAFITTWMTFVPCFLWIFLGGPHIEQLRGNERVTTTLSAITAAVVGVVLNLAVWFALNVLFPGNGSVDWFALAVSIITFAGMLKWKWEIIPVVIGAGVAGLVFRHFGW